MVPHFTSTHPLYDRYARPATNNPITIAAIFITFFMAYPATAPTRNPPPAEKRKSSTGNSEVSTPCQLWHTILFEVLNLICDRHFYVRFILYQTTNLHTIPYVWIR